MKRAIMASIEESPSRIVAGGGWHSNGYWKRHEKSATCMAFALIWSGIVFLIHTLIQTPEESSGFLGLSLTIWLLLMPATGLLGFAFRFWRKETATSQESKSKPIPPYHPRNLY
jgi:hypothetical protein